MSRAALIEDLRFTSILIEFEGYTCNKVNDNNVNTKVMPI